MPEKSPSTARLEAFSDGVIAVIITIMVLELKVPHEDGAAGLSVITPILLIYLLSFTFTGIYWINHQHLIERVESADRLILYANLGFLFCLSLLPFFTAYVIEKKTAAFAVALYAISMIVTGFSFLLLRIAIHRVLRRSRNLRPEDTAERGKHLASLVLYLLAVPLAYFHAGLSLILIAVVTIIWIVPSLAISRKAGS
ncbi:MAG: DUF1211 domain-containing protein [Acidobacteriaceae bacterium]|nr:DUF1211 domain-containing protein [Acidobacteriaceae bacterium]